jgi:hypothetical protein
MPHIKPIAVRLAKGIAELSVDPGSTGITQGNHVAAAPRSAELHRIRIPAARDRVKALVGFSASLIDLHAILQLWPALFSLRPITHLLSSTISRCGRSQH